MAGAEQSDPSGAEVVNSGSRPSTVMMLLLKVSASHPPELITCNATVYVPGLV